MTLNCLVTGVGGQGTVLLSRLIGAASMRRGLDVRGTETIGMAQRGGSVVSHLRLGGVIHSPLIPPGKVDIVIAFEPGEAVRVLPFLAEKGTLLVLDRPVMPFPLAGGSPYEPLRMIQYLRECFGKTGRLAVLDGPSLAEKCGSVKTANTALLGAALGRGLFPFDENDVLEALAERLKPSLVEINVKALETGKEYAYAC
ncbi:MAG: indolepyruvate oxidoreductase subunit beta [Treponema sp.]|nr:indolepyruvate oxidoreductase subunit beta [Treponema sp.]